jgi:hypothetical protein
MLTRVLVPVRVLVSVQVEMQARVFDTLGLDMLGLMALEPIDFVEGP